MKETWEIRYKISRFRSKSMKVKASNMPAAVQKVRRQKGDVRIVGAKKLS